MAVRDFDGVDDRIRLSPGTITTSIPGGKTFVAIIKTMSAPDPGAREAIIGLNRTDDVNAGFYVFDTACNLGLFNDGSTQSSKTATMTATVADSWCLVAVSKATGTATPRFHRYKYSTTTWTHEDGDVAIGDGTAGANQVSQLGSWFDTFDFYDSQIAVAGVWQSVLSDLQLETLGASLQAWVALNPDALWPLNQESIATAVTDITSHGANQSAITGTAVIVGDDPPGFSFSLSVPQPMATPALLIQRGLWRPWMGGEPATPDPPAPTDVPYIVTQYGGFY